MAQTLPTNFEKDRFGKRQVLKKTDLEIENNFIESNLMKQQTSFAAKTPATKAANMKTANMRATSIKALLTSCFVAGLVPSMAFTAHAEIQAGTPAAKPLDYMIAIVNDTPILASDLAEAVANAKASFAAANQPLPPQKTLEAKVLDRLITRTSQMSLIRQTGQSMSDEAINATLLQLANKQGMSSLSEFQEALEAQQTGGYAALRKQIREEMTIEQLRQQALRQRVNISEQDIDYFLRSPESQKLFKSKYHTYHFRVNVPTGIASDNQRAAAFAVAKQIKQDLEANKSLDDIRKNAQAQQRFSVQGGDMGAHSQNALPPYLKDAILSLNVGETTDPVVNQDGIHVAKLVNKQAEEAKKVTQWQVRHILVKPNQLVNLAQAKQSIDELYEKLRQDANFSTLASTYSDDPGSAKKGGSLDWVSLGTMVPEFEDMMQRTPVGDYSTPFRTQFGWHILKVEAQREKDMTTEFKRKLARETLYKRMSSQAIEDWMQELRANSYIKILDPRFKS